MSVKNIKMVCEWTGEEFYVDFKHRNQRFVDKTAMYAWRKAQTHEKIKCLHCGNEFERYKNGCHPRTGLPQQYCSNACNRSSIGKKQKLSKWMTENNPMSDLVSKTKIADTKLRLYGDARFNNHSKAVETCMQKYGVPYTTFLPQVRSNGKRISKFQKRVYADVQKTHADAKLEHYLSDAKKSVDIYVHSKKLVVECFGDYWHCNPKKYAPDYYHQIIKLTAKEIWDKDAIRVEQLKRIGYDVWIVWES